MNHFVLRIQSHPHSTFSTVPLLVHVLGAHFEYITTTYSVEGTCCDYMHSKWRPKNIDNAWDWNMKITRTLTMPSERLLS